MSDGLAVERPFLTKASTLSAALSWAPLNRFAAAIAPSASWYRRWWFFTTLCALATAFFSPWEVAFTEEPGLRPYTDAPAVAEYLLTAVFVTDIFVQLSVAFINADGKIEMRRRAIATHYLRFMFWVDLIGVIPFNTIAEILDDTQGSKRRLAFLRLFRLVRVHRLWALSRDFEMNIHLPLITITLIRNLTIVIVANHWAACSFYYIARRYGFDDDTWIGADLTVLEDADLGEQSLRLQEWEKYVYSLYWVITTMTTVGYGDFCPKNVAEVVFAIMYMLFNIALNSYILGTITLVVIKADEATSRQRRGYEKVERFAHQHRLPAEMLKNLNNHLKYNYLHPEVQDWELMVNLPSNLRRKAMNILYGQSLQNSPVFEGCSEAFIASLLEPDGDLGLPGFSTELYMTGEEIVTQDANVSCLYVLLSGTAYIEKLPLGKSDAFPVEAFLDGSAIPLEFLFSPYSVQASSTCRLLCIQKKTILRVLDAFPQDRELFLDAALNFAQSYSSHSSVLAQSNRSFSCALTPLLPRTSDARFGGDEESVYLRQRLFVGDLGGDEAGEAATRCPPEPSFDRTPTPESPFCQTTDTTVRQAS